MAPYNLRTRPKPKLPPCSGIVKKTPVSRRGKKALSVEKGLLSLDKTPDRLVYITRKNFTESRLLRLPAELRTKIFEYVFTRHEPIHVSTVNHPQCRDRGPACILDDRVLGDRIVDHQLCNDLQLDHRNLISYGQYERNIGITTRRPHMLQNFTLLRVCRQIYSEARLMFYTGNTFTMDSYDRHLETFHRMLVEGQREAVLNLELDPGDLNYEMDSRAKVSGGVKTRLWSEPLTEMFPNLQRVMLVETHGLPGRKCSELIRKDPQGARAIMLEGCQKDVEVVLPV